MPKHPKIPCSHPGCPQLVEAAQGSRCEKHKRQEQKRYDQQRGTAAQRGYDSRWRKYRIKFLAQHPYCVECLKQGKFVFATVVDHIKPHKGDKKLFWDPNNHQSLCKPCHDRKTATEDGGFGNTPQG